MVSELKEEERILILSILGKINMDLKILSILGKINMDLKIKIIDDINRYLFLENCQEQIYINEIELESLFEETYLYETDNDSLDIQSD